MVPGPAARTAGGCSRGYRSGRLRSRKYSTRPLADVAGHVVDRRALPRRFRARPGARQPVPRPTAAPRGSGAPAVTRPGPAAGGVPPRGPPQHADRPVHVQPLAPPGGHCGVRARADALPVESRPSRTPAAGPVTTGGGGASGSTWPSGRTNRGLARGIEPDPEPLLVHGPVMAPAQQHQVRQRRLPAVRPVVDVVRIAPRCPAAGGSGSAGRGRPARAAGPARWYVSGGRRSGPRRLARAAS